MALNIIGKKIVTARKKAVPRITQKDLAARLEVQGIHIERVGISKIEAGNQRVNDIEIAAIAKALNVTVAWLFGEETSRKTIK